MKEYEDNESEFEVEIDWDNIECPEEDIDEEVLERSYEWGLQDEEEEILGVNVNSDIEVKEIKNEPYEEEVEEEIVVEGVTSDIKVKEIKKEPKRHVWHITTDVVHPKTGQEILSEKRIRNVLSSRDGLITKWAYILHDKDRKPNGEVINPHWHIAIYMKDNKRSAEAVSKWFGIPSNFVNKSDIEKEGQDGSARLAFPRLVQYLDHRAEEGKYKYSSSEIKSNFDIEREIGKLGKKDIGSSRDNKKKDLKERWIYEVMYEGRRVREIYKECKGDREAAALYNGMRPQLKRARNEYLSNQPIPNRRYTILITGQGRIGKSTLANGLCRYLAGVPDDVSYKAPEWKDYVFQTGGSNVTFQNYDGQKVVLWDDQDCRGKHSTFTEQGKQSIKRMLDTDPKPQDVNIKFDSVELRNEWNIITTVTDARTFIESLVEGEYDENKRWIKSEDKGQAYGRFPFILIFTPNEEEDYDLSMWICDKFFGGDRSAVEWDGWRKSLKIVGNIPCLNQMMGNYEITEEERNKILRKCYIEPLMGEADSLLRGGYKGLPSGTRNIGADLTLGEIIEYPRSETEYEYSDMTKNKGLELSKNDKVIYRYVKVDEDNEKPYLEELYRRSNN